MCGGPYHSPGRAGTLAPGVPTGGRVMRFRAGRRRGRAVLALLAGLLAGGWVGGGLVYVFHRTKFQEAAGRVADVSLAPAEELALVPADAAGFVHVRAADLWRSDAMAEYRRVVGKAGDDALKA